MSVSFIGPVALVYAIVESLEKFGLERKYAHILAVPIGIAISFVWYNSISIKEHIVYGIITGLMSVGSCDTLCNVFEYFQKKN